MKLLKVLLPLALCFLLLAGCGKKVELAGWEDYKDPIPPRMFTPVRWPPRSGS